MYIVNVAYINMHCVVVGCHIHTCNDFIQAYFMSALICAVSHAYLAVLWSRKAVHPLCHFNGHCTTCTCSFVEHSRVTCRGPGSFTTCKTLNSTSQYFQCST